MLDKKFWDKVFKEQANFDVSRRKIIAESAAALHGSKLTIFALHRDDLAEAKTKLDEAKKGLQSLDKRFGKDFRLRMEGSWKAGVEEFVEAKLFYDFCTSGKITGIKDLSVEADEYIGGMSDLTGEILRKMIIWATQKEDKKLKPSAEVIGDVVHVLMQQNLGGYLRTKFDQAKKNQRKCEEVLYDISLRR
ncbi:MAG: hypothetical protein UT02_C0037G0007 [Parcubacteria group bacterium GW2011_GWC2_38_7]|nr:MAG: hypothetical protein UT02_C0037G0007 [Parcubacteria group bacterium GW2011_GWC2_38_7]